MKIIKLYDNILPFEYIKNEYEHLAQQVGVYPDKQNDNEEDFIISYLYKDVICKEDSWKFIMLASCSIVGLLDRHRIKAMIKWPNIICVNDKKIASVHVETIGEEKFKGIVLTVRLNMNRSLQDICMKDITKKTYKMNVLVTGLTTFLNIYDNLYHTHQFFKVLDYANDISYLKNKKVNYLNYGTVSFIKLDSHGILSFIDDEGVTHQKHISETEEI